jgi:hypothetical protein
VTTDDDRSSSEDLLRQAKESVREPLPPTPEPVESMGDMAEMAADPPAGVPTPRPTVRPSSPVPGRSQTAEIGLPDAPADHRRGLLFAVAAAAAGAAVWAFILAYAEIQSWLLGIGIGYLIGLAAIRGAGQLTNQLRVTVIVLTFAAVIVGELLGTALLINKEFEFFDFPLAVELYFDNLGSDFAFALGSAAIGSWAALSAAKK